MSSMFRTLVGFEVLDKWAIIPVDGVPGDAGLPAEEQVLTNNAAVGYFAVDINTGKSYRKNTAGSGSDKWEEMVGKTYVDNLVDARPWKDAARLKDDTSYANLAAAVTAVQTGTIDGVSVALTDEILFTNITGEDKAVYVIGGASIPAATLTQREDMDPPQDGDALYIQEGSSADRQYAYTGTSWASISSDNNQELAYIRTYIGKTAAGSENPDWTGQNYVTGSLYAAAIALDNQLKTVTDWGNHASENYLKNIEEDTSDPKFGANVSVNDFELVGKPATVDDGGAITLRAANAIVAGDGGSLGFYAGTGGTAANFGDGGDIDGLAGAAIGNGNGGDYSIKSGAGGTGSNGPGTTSIYGADPGTGDHDGGDIQVIAYGGGSGASSAGKGGDILLRSGPGGGANKDGGDITFQLGAQDGTGSIGMFYLQAEDTLGGQQTELRFKEINGSDYVGIKAADSLTGFWTMTLPTAAPSVNGYVLSGNTDGTTSWTAAPAGSLDGLSDTNITAAAKGDILVYDGSDWVDLTAGTNGHVLSANSTTGTGLEWVAASAGSLSGLSDTTITAANNGDTLVYDGTTGMWIDFTVGTDNYALLADSSNANGGVNWKKVVLNPMVEDLDVGSYKIKSILNSAVAVTIEGGDTDSGAQVGDVKLRGGNVLVGSVANPGGAINLTAGNNLRTTGFVSGGNFTGYAGNATASTDGIGGSAVIRGGNGGGTGGSVILEIGADITDNSADGSVKVYSLNSGVHPEVRWYDKGAPGDNYIALRSPATVPTDRTWQLPDDDPAVVGVAKAQYYLTTNTSGDLSFNQIPVFEDDKTAATGTVILDAVLTDEVRGVEWLITGDQGGDSVLFKVVAVHNGSENGVTDADEFDYTVYAALEAGSADVNDPEVELNGTGAAQVMRVVVDGKTTTTKWRVVSVEVQIATASVPQ